MVWARRKREPKGEDHRDHRETYLFLGSSKHEPRREETEQEDG